MKFEKKVISDLTLCYCITPLIYEGKRCFIVASEKKYPCYLFDEDGNKLDEIWNGPGGTMSATQIPGSNGVFLATQKSYSPNDAKEAEMVMAKPTAEGWKVQTVAKLPFLHRFDILERNGHRYILACCMKSDHEYKDDWRFPGATYATKLPDDLADWNEDQRLDFKLVKDNMLKNHGYTKQIVSGVETGIVACDEGCFRFWPPEEEDGTWNIEQLTSEGASDALFGDWDGCGKEELITISPFHGDTVSIYKEVSGKLEKVWTFPQKMTFAHAICSVKTNGREYALIGWRREERDLVLIDGYDGVWKTTTIDKDVGSANAYYLKVGEKDVIISANREINEIAYYTIKEN